MQTVELTYKEITQLKRASYLRGVNMSRVIIVVTWAIVTVILLN